MKTVKIHHVALQRVEAGHPWIYRSQIKDTDPGISPGDYVKVVTERDRFIGCGLINPSSQICIRLLTRESKPLDIAFLRSRIEEAARWRRSRLHREGTARRWINSEADGLPGVILDEYSGVFVLQTPVLGMDLRKSMLCEAITDFFHPKTLYERNDFPARSFEGLSSVKGCIGGEPEPQLIEIDENGCKFWVDIVQGHKTGFYLDQSENRKLAGSLAKGARVLDCFAYTGAFAVSCLVHGAESVRAVESSPDALSLARRNAELNGLLERWSDIEGNVFDILKSLSNEEKKFDMIILDPPSFTKTKASIEPALGGYKEINLRAMRLLSDSGILVTASCSHHIHESMFDEILVQSARDAGRRLRLIYRTTQALDHPIVPAIPETRYLKCYFLEVKR